MHEIDSGYPLSPEQQVALDAGHPAAQLRIGLNGGLDEKRLRQALLSLVARHESLRLALRLAVGRATFDAFLAAGDTLVADPGASDEATAGYRLRP